MSHLHRMLSTRAMFLGIVLGAALSGHVGASEEGEVRDGLQPGPNQDLVVQNCTACHSGRPIAQAELTRSQWDDVIDWMQEQHGMWELEPETRDKILEYLEEVQGIPDR